MKPCCVFTSSIFRIFEHLYRRRKIHKYTTSDRPGINKCSCQPMMANSGCISAESDFVVAELPRADNRQHAVDVRDGDRHFNQIWIIWMRSASVSETGWERLCTNRSWNPWRANLTNRFHWKANISFIPWSRSASVTQSTHNIQASIRPRKYGDALAGLYRGNCALIYC